VGGDFVLVGGVLALVGGVLEEVTLVEGDFLKPVAAGVAVSLLDADDTLFTLVSSGKLS